MRRNRIAFFASLIMLSLVMVIWRDMFLFAKSAPWPKWSYFLPYPFILTSDIVFICLLVVAFFTDSFRYACMSVVMCVFLSVLALVIFYMLSEQYQVYRMPIEGVVFSVIINYVFIILFHCAFPMFFVLFIRGIFNFIQKKYGQ